MIFQFRLLFSNGFVFILLDVEIFFQFLNVLEQVYCLVCSDIVNYQKEIFVFWSVCLNLQFCCDKSDMGKSELFLFVNQEIQMILLTSL